MKIHGFGLWSPNVLSIYLTLLRYWAHMGADWWAHKTPCAVRTQH